MLQMSQSPAEFSPSAFFIDDSGESLKSQLNNCRGPSYTKISKLRPGLPYRIVSFERAMTRIGETIALTLEGKVGDDFFLRVYLPPRFIGIFTNEKISNYNSGIGDRLSLQWRGGLSNNIEFV